MMPKLASLLSTLFGTSFFLTVARLGGAGTGIILQILIARFYGADVLGTYYVALSLGGILSVFISMGYPWIVAPILADHEADSHSTSLKAFLQLVRKDALLLTGLFSIPIALLIWLYPEMATDKRYALLIGLATAPVYLVMRLCGGIANAMKFFQLANLPELLFRPVLTLCFVAAALAFSVPIGSVSIVTLNFLIVVALTVWMALALRQKTRSEFVGAAGDAPLSGQETSKLRRLAVPMIFSTLFVNMFADMDILMIGLILPVDEAGIFGVAMKIAALLVFAVQVTHQILLRDAANAHLAADSQKMHRIIGKANVFAIVSSIASLIGLLLFGKFVLGLFGPEFQAAYVCLLGLIIAQIIRASAGPAIQILMITKNQRAGIPVYICSTVLLFVSNLVLVPLFKYEGAAAAVIITTLFWSVWLNHLAKQKTGYQVSIFGKSRRVH
ncbi:oligosaccharide flippase family protein [Pararhizobium sp. IMCC21322]|uniref:oligosaccharide flippase family protein n=1 Tax=Pararhizobium sp. IMCC21322 TaxID=3067903 RepID=UPI0027405DED|nr:oligosaccharide flippase family protein [Pararhizobium sp. IMCC21322]